MLLVSDPAPIKVNGIVVINYPQHCKRVRCLHQRDLGSFSLYKVTKLKWVILSLALGQHSRMPVSRRRWYFQISKIPVVFPAAGA